MTLEHIICALVFDVTLPLKAAVCCLIILNICREPMQAHRGIKKRTGVLKVILKSRSVFKLFKVNLILIVDD